MRCTGSGFEGLVLEDNEKENIDEVDHIIIGSPVTHHADDLSRICPLWQNMLDQNWLAVFSRLVRFYTDLRIRVGFEVIYMA